MLQMYRFRGKVIVGISAVVLLCGRADTAVAREEVIREVPSMSSVQFHVDESVVLFPEEGDPMSQVNSVSQLRDVFPGDWAYEALRTLVERYGCIAGYPNGTFQGNRALSRYEFAAGLNACLQQIERIFAENPGDLGHQDDVNTLQRLVQEFETELVTLGTRVDNLEDRTASLEANQFSTTTKLQGEVIIAVTDVLAGDSTQVTFPSVISPTGTTTRDSPEQNTVFANRVRLNFLTSFTGEDELKIGLASGNFPHPSRLDGGFQYGPSPLLGFFGGPEFSPEGQQTFNDIASLPANNTVGLTSLSYEFSLGEKLRTVIMAEGGEHHDYIPTTFSSWDDDNGGTGSLSVFGQRSGIYNFESGAGLGFTYQLSDAISLSAGYIATYANEPSSARSTNPLAGGLFGGRYSALAQLTVKPSDTFSFGLTYNHSYHPAGGPFSSTPIFLSDQGTVLSNFPIIPAQEVSVDSYGVGALWQVSPQFAINGWFAYSRVNSNSDSASIFQGGSFVDVDYEGSSADILTYGIALAFPDLGGEGNLGGLVIGASPYATRAEVPTPFQTGGNWFLGSDLGEDFTDLIPDNAIPWHIEGFYRYKLTDHIYLTPGVIWLTAPNQSARNPDVVIGTLRATFLF
ncbi:MAG: iron uptake porin [Coleofasciculus sp. D1-CHI-01]|uniref:iron uptake porin n=1 Tax=Coleofasciculus sp. D1-CHI-01 TaxID=3068482 RepID=UPI0033042F0D